MTRLLPLALFALAACGPATDSTTPVSGEAALDQSPTMGTTTQQSVSGSEMAGGDAVGATAPAGTADQYGNLGPAAADGRRATTPLSGSATTGDDQTDASDTSPQ